MNYDTQKLIFDQYAEGTIHVFEMVERVLSTITPADLRHHFMVAPVEFDEKLGLEPLEGTDEASRKREMQMFVAGLLNTVAGLFAETFDGFVPTIESHADGCIVVVEQDVHSEEHRQSPNMLPTVTRVFTAEELLGKPKRKETR